MKSAFLFLTKLLVLAVLVGLGLTAYEAHRFLTAPASSEPKDVIISIAPGATFDRVAWELKKAGAVTDVPRFRLLAQFKDVLGKVRAGEFMVNTGWTPEQVLLQITEGRAVLYRLFVREGLTWWETARAVEEQGFATYEDFKAVIRDPAFLAGHDIPFADAEGFLFPETYLLKKPRTPLDREQARIVASAMVGMFWKKTEPLWKTLPMRTDIQPDPRMSGAMRSPPPAPDGTPGATLQGQPSAPETTVPPTGPPASGLGTPPLQETSGAAQDASVSSLPPIPAGALAESPVQAVPLPDLAGAPAENAGAAQPGTPASASGESEESARSATTANGPRTPADIDPAALRHLVILASLVEKETSVPTERGLVAGVYANRLRLGMLLQCDPTIIYGVGETFSGAIRRSQLDDPKNPYNTYQHPGLPPGPICSSGFDALRAAANPERHDYLYFVATGTDGGHTFSKNLNDHNKAVQVYRSRLRGKN